MDEPVSKSKVMHLSLQSEATLDQETRDLYKELCSATKQGDLEKTESLVKSFGAPINFVDEWQCSPLYWACLCGHYEVVKFLLENGAQCDRNTFQGERCLYGALNSEIRNLLLSYKLTKAIDENQPYLQFLSGLLAKPDYKDLTFTIPLADQDGAAYREFSVHRFVLAARSEFFRLRLLTRWRGNTRISLQATLVDSVSFAAILGFLYTGHIGDLEPSALDNAVFVCKHLELWNAVERFRDIQEDTQNADRSHDSKEIARIRGDLGACLACLIDTAVKILPGSNDKSYIVSERFVHTAVPRDPLSTFADVAVRLDDVVFPCHKACLVRSEYFEAMLGGMFSEAEMDASSIQFEDGNCLTVPMLQVHGIDADLFPHILEYMYTDRCMVPAELAYELMLAADMLLLDRLKGIAAIVLTNQEEPVMDIYQLIRTAVDLNIDRLEQWCIKYFAEHFDDFIHKEEFKALILESAESIAGRQETDTIPFVDDLRYFLSKKYSVDEEDINEDGTMNEEYRDTWTELILQYRSKLTILDDVLVSLGLEAPGVSIPTMSSRHQAPYTRYASANVANASMAVNNDNLNVPFASQSNISTAGYSSQSASSYNTTPTMASPYTASSSPGYHSPNMQKHPLQPPLKKYSLQPPHKQLPLSKTMPAMGYPGMFPQRPSQDEDILTESNVRNGFIDRPVVSNEHTCAHDIVYGKLQDDQRLLGELGNFMVDVLKRKKTAERITGPASFKPPIRSTLIDSKKEQWMQELAAGVVSLRKLARNVPHGFKGEKLLETLAARQVPFLRATWYIKVVGLSEMSQRNASNSSNSTSQSLQWTYIVTDHLKKQLAELANINASAPPARGYKGHPSTPNQHDSAPKPWATAESRARFEQRWAYSTRLTQWQYVEGLLEQRNFLRWTLDALRNSSTFEIMWLILTGIVQDYVDEYRRNRTLMKLLIDTLIKAYSALMQIQDHEQVWAYQGLRKDIEHMLQSLFLSTPDMFVVPMLYHQYRHLFDMILGEKPQQSKALPNISRVMSEYWTLVKARNEVFCGTAEQNAPASASTQAVISSVERNPLVPSVVEKPRDTIEEEQVVQILDELGRTIASGSGLLIHGDGWINTEGRTATSAAEAIFDDGHLSKPSVFQIVHIMCRWATSDCRFGDWRVFLVASILHQWQKQDSTFERKHTMQDALIRFLDDSDTDPSMESDGQDHPMTGKDGIKADQSIIFLFDTLIRLQLFSYQKYLLRLIARGDLEVKHRQESRVLRCIYYLSAFPLPSNAPPFLVNQRRVAISNHRSDDTTHQESQDLDRLKYLAKLAILGSEDGSPCLFGQGAKDLTQQTPNDDRSSYHLAITDTIEQELHLALDRASRYTILHFTSEWLVQEVKRFVVKNVQIGEDNWRVMTSPGSCLLNARQYVMVIKILEYAKDYLSLVDVALWVLEKTNERDLYLYIIDTLRRHANIWKLVDKTGNRIAETFLAKHNSLQNRGNRERSLMMYIVQLVQEGYQMKSDMHAQFQQDLQAKPRVGYVGSSMSLLEDLTLLASNPTNASARTLAESLYSRYHSTAGSIQSILETSITAIRHAIRVKDDPTLAPMQFELYSILAAFADLFRQLGEQATITGQLDMVIVSWLTQQDLSNTDMPSAFMEEMNQPHSWIPLFITLLIARGAVNLDTIFRNNVLPWFGQIGGAIQQQTEPDLSVDVTENRLLQFCKNLVVLVRLLIVQDHCHLATENGADSTAVTWDLRVEDIFHLEAQRLSQLSSSLNKIEPMFRLMEHLLIIATNLPLSSSLLQDLVMLRAALLQIGWFRQACIRDLHGVYQRFAANEAEAATEKKIKKKMLCIVDELIGGNLCETRSSMVSEAAPDFIDKLQRVFTNMNQWNEEQCRVQVNLLLDNIMLSEGNMLNHNNPHILGDDATADLSLTSNVLPSTSEMPSSNKDLDSFVQFFYDMVLSPPKDDEQPSGAQRRATFFKNLIHGVRESVLLELLKYAMRLLEGDPDMPFPGNMLLLQTSDAATTNNGTDVVWDSEQYAHKNQTFLTIVQHMTAENVWTTEKKIEMVKMLYKQIKQFKNAIPTYKVMQGAHATYADAVRALQLVKNDVNLAIVLLVTDGLPDYQPSESIEEKVTLQDIRTSLLIRLRLMVPFVSLIWEHPLKTECDILEWIQVLVPLLVNPVVHGNGKQERFFEFVLDFVSLLIDEVPKDLRKANLNQLSSMQTELSSVPAIFHSRLKRILPFLTHNIYLTSTRIGSALLGLSPAVDPQQQQQHLEACLDQSKPWEWLEDYMSDPPHDNDVPVNLAIFNARKSKRADGTYIRWFKHGFDEGFASDNSEASWRVCAMGKYRPQSNRPTDDNGFNFIVTDDEEMPDHHGSSASTPRKRPLDMEEGELLQ